MSYPLDTRNTKKTRNKMLIFINNNLIYLSQIVSKKANVTISFFMKNSKNNNIILGFSFMYVHIWFQFI